MKIPLSLADAFYENYLDIISLNTGPSEQAACLLITGSFSAGSVIFHLTLFVEAFSRQPAPVRSHVSPFSHCISVTSCLMLASMARLKAWAPDQQ